MHIQESGHYSPDEKETYNQMLRKNSKDLGINVLSGINILEVAQNATFIANGYAFTKETNNIRVLNLNNTDKSSVLDVNGNVLMTSMDDVEISIVKKYFERNKDFLKDD